MTFVQNQWYVAAYAAELGRSLLARTILGEPMVLFRASSGRPVALADRCVHRHFPLSQSQLVDDTIVCGYHGFTYGTDGRCVAVPGQQRIPRTARVNGDVVATGLVRLGVDRRPDRADATLIPRAPWLADERYTTVAGMEPLAARYGLLVDNLLDLSHETYLHGGYIGTPEVADTPITTEVDEARGIIRVSRRMADAACPPFYAESTGITGRIDRWQDIEYRRRACTCCTAGWPRRGAARPRRHRPGRVPRRGGVRDHPVHRDHRPMTSGRWPATSRSVTRRCPTFLHDGNRTVVLQDVAALNTLEQVIAAEPPGLPGAAASTSTPAGWPPGECWPGWPPRLTSQAPAFRPPGR